MFLLPHTHASLFVFPRPFLFSPRPPGPLTVCRPPPPPLPIHPHSPGPARPGPARPGPARPGHPGPAGPHAGRRASPVFMHQHPPSRLYATEREREREARPEHALKTTGPARPGLTLTRHGPARPLQPSVPLTRFNPHSHLQHQYMTSRLYVREGGREIGAPGARAEENRPGPARPGLDRPNLARPGPIPTPIPLSLSGRERERGRHTELSTAPATSPGQARPVWARPGPTRPARRTRQALPAPLSQPPYPIHLAERQQERERQSIASSAAPGARRRETNTAQARPGTARPGPDRLPGGPTLPPAALHTTIQGPKRWGVKKNASQDKGTAP